jgi:hypothetical protein
VQEITPPKDKVYIEEEEHGTMEESATAYDQVYAYALQCIKWSSGRLMPFPREVIEKPLIVTMSMRDYLRFHSDLYPEETDNA